MKKRGLTRDQIMRGKNLDPRSRLERARKGAAASPWSKSHMVDSKSPRRGYTPRTPRGLNDGQE